MINDLLERLSSGQVFVLIIILMGITGGVVKGIAAQWRKIREAEMEAGLKQDMLNRGMSAEEIKVVLSATAKKTLC